MASDTILDSLDLLSAIIPRSGHPPENRRFASLDPRVFGLSWKRLPATASVAREVVAEVQDDQDSQNARNAKEDINHHARGENAD